MSDNAFKQIEPDDNLPPETKAETLSNLFSLKLVLDLVDLFVVKAGATFGASISGPSEPLTTSDPSSSDHED
ncbi:MAG: hypothetical protein AAFV07_11360 [Bacteroidota bacterium]